jgi:hypothetical protein
VLPGIYHREEEMEHGVRYVTVKVHTDTGLEDIGKEVADALKNHKVEVSWSSAKHKAFSEVEVAEVVYSYQHNLRQKA